MSSVQKYNPSETSASEAATSNKYRKSGFSWDDLKLKRHDRYIITKFLGAFFLILILMISVAVVFDISEKIDDFMEHEAPLKAIVFNYYLNFIPYYANLFSPLLTFIAVIYFTSKMANNSEIIATYASGISFYRITIPYMFSALVIALMTFYLSGYVIPPANAERLDFQEEYVKKKRRDNVLKVQMEVNPNEILYIDYFDKEVSRGHRVSMDVFDDKTLVSRITASYILWDSCHNWHYENYTKRDFNGLYENITKGDRLDTEISVIPADFFVYPGLQEQMTNDELLEYIDRQKSRGIGNIQAFELEYERRFAFPFAAFILTIIGLSLSSKKIKGGMGVNIVLGLFLSILYILFYSMSSTFTVNGALSPRLATWVPNIVFTFVAAFLYKRAQK